MVVLLVLVAALITRDWQDLVRAAIGWAAAGLLYFVLWFLYPRGLGFGDVRLSGVLGLALGYLGRPSSWSACTPASSSAGSSAGCWRC